MDSEIVKSILKTTPQAINVSIQEQLDGDKKVETPLEIMRYKFKLERYDHAVQKSLNFKIKELKQLLKCEYDKKFLPKDDDDLAGGDKSENSTRSEHSDLPNKSSKMDVEHNSDTEVYKQWMGRVRKLKRMAARRAKKLEERHNELSEDRYSDSKSSTSMKSSKSSLYFEGQDKIPWQPLKIIIGPERRNGQYVPCIIPISDPIDMQNEKLQLEKNLEKLISSKSLRSQKNNEIEPIVTSNTEVFFLHQVKRKTYFKCLNLLAEHYKQSDLLIRSLHQEIDGFFTLPTNRSECNESKCIGQIKIKLNEQVQDIEEDVKQWYAILGINDITDIKRFVPKPDQFSERKYRFVEEVHLKKLIVKYLSENKLVQEKFKAMNTYQDKNDSVKTTTSVLHANI